MEGIGTAEVFSLTDITAQIQVLRLPGPGSSVATECILSIFQLL